MKRSLVIGRLSFAAALMLGCSGCLETFGNGKVDSPVSREQVDAALTVLEKAGQVYPKAGQVAAFARQIFPAKDADSWDSITEQWYYAGEPISIELLEFERVAKTRRKAVPAVIEPEPITNGTNTTNGTDIPPGFGT